MAVTAATDRVFEAFYSDDRSKAFYHGHSYTANPLGCAVALASLDLFQEEGTLKRVQELEIQMKARLELFRGHTLVADVRGIGGVAVLELATSKGGYLDEIGPKLASEFVNRNLLLRPMGNILYFMPPYVITESEVDWAFDQIHDVLK